MIEKEFDALVGILKLGNRKKTHCDTKTKLKKNIKQKKVLETIFKMTSYPSSITQQDLAILLQIPQRSIQIWFQNARHKMKNINANGECFIDDNNDIPVSILYRIIFDKELNYK
ncbi:hypothetical protein P3W45_001422 [Vairimorpha bombi]|jgi:hypothetical protein